MTDRRRESLGKWLLVLLALTPALFYAYLGMFSRLVSDWLLIAQGKALNPLEHIGYWRADGSGSYSYFVLHSLVAPLLDELVAPLTPLVIVCLWLLASACLIAQFLTMFGCERDRWKIALSLASLAVAASVQALYHPQAFYWYSASTRYVLPLAALVVFLSLVLWAARSAKPRRSLVFWTLAGAGICFATAGLSELHGLFQWMLLCLLLVFVMLATERLTGLRLAAMLGSGLGATTASLVIQLSTPATHYRMVENLAQGNWRPIRKLTDLVSSTAVASFDNLGDQSLFASFMLLLVIGLAIGIYVGNRRASQLRAEAFRLKRAPLWLALLAQICFAPILWTHLSDDPLVFGRFSLLYTFVLAVNAVLTTALALLILRRDAVTALLRRLNLDEQFLALLTLLIIIALFIPTQMRNMHYSAATFFFASALSLILALCWQLLPGGKSGGVKSFGRFTLAWQLMTILCAGALVAAMHYSQGSVQPRVLSAVAWMGTLCGLFWGGFLGMLLGQTASGGAATSRLKQLRNLALCTGFVLWLGLLARQMQSLRPLSAFAGEWDARHALMREWQESGKSDLSVPQLEVDISEFFCCSNSSSAKNANVYYGFRKLADRR